MNIVLKNKIHKNGDLCIRVIDHVYPQNDSKIRPSKISPRLSVTTLKIKNETVLQDDQYRDEFGK